MGKVMGYWMGYPASDVRWLTSLGRQAEALFSNKWGCELVSLSWHTGRTSSKAGKALCCLKPTHFSSCLAKQRYQSCFADYQLCLPGSAHELMGYIAFQVSESGVLVWLYWKFYLMVSRVWVSCWLVKQGTLTPGTGLILWMISFACHTPRTSIGGYEGSRGSSQPFCSDGARSYAQQRAGLWFSSPAWVGVGQDPGMGRLLIIGPKSGRPAPCWVSQTVPHTWFGKWANCWSGPRLGCCR